jgi:hypothetical protein
MAPACQEETQAPYTAQAPMEPTEVVRPEMASPYEGYETSGPTSMAEEGMVEEGGAPVSMAETAISEGNENFDMGPEADIGEAEAYQK